jgi:hypothetical protein
VEDGDRQQKPSEDVDYSSSASSKKRKGEEEDAEERDVELHQQKSPATQTIWSQKSSGCAGGRVRSEACLWCWEVRVWVFSLFFICFGVMGLFYSVGLCGALCLIWCWDESFLVAVLIVVHV